MQKTHTLSGKKEHEQADSVVCVCVKATHCCGIKQIQDEGDGAAVDANEKVDT